MRKLYVLLMAFMLAFAANAQTITIGTGTTTSGQSPWDIFYGYSYVQTIYLGSEINASGNITAIKYYYAGSSLTNNQGIKVYMATVARSSFSSTTNWEPLSNLTLVYDGVVGSPTVPGWITITLTTPFAYNSTSGNLLIAVDENTSGNNGSTRFRSTTLTPSNRVLYYRSDATNPDPASPPAGTQSSVVGNIQIEGLTLGCQLPTAITAGSVTTTSATVSWTAPAAGPTPAGYAYEVRTSGAPGSGATGLVTSGNSASTSVNLSTLASGTTYAAYVRTDCGSGNFSGWSTAFSFTTLCDAYNPPYTLNFESVTPPAIPNCTSIQKIGSGNNWATANVTTNGFNSNVLQYGYNTSNAANAWFYTGGLNLTAGVSYRLVFKYGNNSTTYVEKLAVKFGTAAVNTSMNDLIVDLPSITGGTAAFSTTDFTVPTTGVYYIGFNAYSAANQFNLYVDDINVATTPTCESPLTLSLVTRTNNSADVDWTPPASAPASYDIYWSTSNTAPTGSTTPGATGITNPYHITGLAANTTYYVWVRGNCGSGNVGNWSNAFSFKTLCSAVTTFSENFNGVTAPALPDCWYKVGAGGSAYTQATDANSTPNTLYFYSGSTSSLAVMAMPAVSNLANNTHQLKFNMRANFTVGGNVEVGYLTDPNDPNSFVTLQTVTASSLTYQPYVVVPGAVSAEVLAFRHTGSPANSVLIDDVRWEAIPSCVEPTAVTVSNITTTGADLDWTAPAQAPASYDVYVSMTNTAPTGATTPTYAGIANPYSLTGLTANTTYYVWVRGNCGSGDVSVWTSVKSFTTQCNPLTTFPWTENFETVTAPAIPSCWTSVDNNNDGDKWITYDNSTYAKSGTKSAGMYTDFNAGANDDYLILPSMTLTANQQLKYWVRARSASEPNDYQVMISTTGTAPGDFSPIFNETVNFTTYAERIVDLSAYSGTVHIAIHVPQGGLDGYYLYMDDFTVENLPTCFAPSAVTVSNITTTGATLDWTAPAQAPASYDVYVSMTNTAPTGTTTPTYTGVANPYSLTGLTANTTYYVWVRGNCGGTDVSAWTTVKSFITACDATNVPYTENFNGVTPPAIPSCIIVENTNNDSQTWRTTTGITGVPAVTSNAIINQYNSAAPADDWFFIRTLNLTAGQSYTLKFKYLASSAPDYTEKLQVQLGTAANSASMTGQVIFDEPNVNSTSYVQASVQFTVPSTGQYVIGFHAYSDADQDLLAVDDINVDITPSCLEPTAITVSNITTTGATVDWTAPAIAPANYDIYVSNTNTAPTGSTTPTATAIGHPYTLTGLTANTTYYVWVRGNCGGANGVSVWSEVKSFTTPCDALNVPYTLNFNSVTTPAIPNCTSVENVNADAYTWETAVAPTGYTGNVLNIRWNGSVAMNDWFYTAGLNLIAGKSYVISYKYSNNASSSFSEKMKVAIGGSPSNAAMTTVLADYPLINDNTPRMHAIRFTVPSTGVYYLGFNGYSDANQFRLYLDDISVTEATVAPTTVNSCVTVVAPRIDGQNNSMWMSMIDANGNIVGEINGNGNNLGNVTVKVYRNSGPVRKDFYGQYYLDRNIEITPTTQPITPVSVRLYFTAAELAALKAQAGSNVNAYTDISVFKNSDACGSAINGGAPKLPTVTSTFETDYVASFDVPSFSSFYFSASTNAILPANILTFSGVRQSGANHLKWTVAQEQDVQAYQVERSGDGRDWTSVGSVTSLGNTTTQRSYSFVDNNISGLKQMYRLRQVDRNGAAKLSKVVVITGSRPTALTLSGLFPNPAATSVNVLVDAPAKDNINVIVMDAVGRVVKTQKASVETGSNTITVDVNGLANGSYLLKVTCESNCQSAVSKFVKE